MKKFKVGSEYKLRAEFINDLCFTDTAERYCFEKYGTKKHVFTGICDSLENRDGGAYLLLGNGTRFYAASYERHMFKRVKTKKAD